MLSEAAALVLRAAAGLAAQLADRLHPPYQEPERKPERSLLDEFDGVFPWPARRPDCFHPADVFVGPDHPEDHHP